MAASAEAAGRRGSRDTTVVIARSLLAIVHGCLQGVFNMLSRSDTGLGHGYGSGKPRVLVRMR